MNTVSKARRLLEAFTDNVKIKSGQEGQWIKEFTDALNAATGQTFKGTAPVSHRGGLSGWAKSESNSINIVFDVHSQGVFSLTKAVTYKGEGPQSITTNGPKNLKDLVASIKANIDHMG